MPATLGQRIFAITIGHGPHPCCPLMLPDLPRPSKALERAPDDLSPVFLDELGNVGQLMPSRTGLRCSDLGFLNMRAAQYIELLDWTARTVVHGKKESLPAEAPPVFEGLNLGISIQAWSELVGNFGRLFRIVAGKPHVVDAHRSVKRRKTFHLSQQARQLLTV